MEDISVTKKKEIQSLCLVETNNYRKRGVAISMGVGKTLIGLQDMEQEILLNSDSKFLVVAPKKAIFKTWKDEAVKFGLEHVLSHISFTTYLSLSKQAKFYDVIYLDECHNLLDSHDFYLSFYTGKILGLTGTPPRYKHSEKGKLVSKHCPIVYTYITDDAIADEILNDYLIYVHQIDLDRRKTVKQVTKKGGFFFVSEKSVYDYWTTKINTTFSPVQKKIFRIMRMKAMMEFPSKELYAKYLMNRVEGKCIIFCNTTEQADRICPNVYHSKSSGSELNLQMFSDGSINLLSCVLQLNEGVNIPNLESGIILHAYSNERKFQQRFGRLLRLSTDKTCTVHVLMFKDSIDVDWVSEAVKDLDPTKVIYLDKII